MSSATRLFTGFGAVAQPLEYTHAPAGVMSRLMAASDAMGLQSVIPTQPPTDQGSSSSGARMMEPMMMMAGSGYGRKRGSRRKSSAVGGARRKPRKYVRGGSGASMNPEDRMRLQANYAAEQARLAAIPMGNPTL